MSQASERVERAGAKLLLGYPWWASLYLHLKRVETTEVLTAAVDGTHLFYNPHYFGGLSDSELLAVLLHETAHIALLHCYRAGGRNPEIWNIAADEKVNALLEADGITLPANCIPPTSLDETVEEAYDRILKNAKKITLSMQDVRSANEAQNDDSPDSLPGQASKEMTEREWRDVLAQNRGLMPSSIARQVQENTEPRVNWRDLLAQFIHTTHRADMHTWNRPSRRVANMPGWKREPESNIAVCVDTSGSVDDPILGNFLAELKAICAIGGISAHVISCDAKVHQIIPPGEPIPDLHGGGGTDFRPALAEAEKLDVSGVVYFTDGDGTFPQACCVPVLWALIRRVAVPFGQSILITGEKQ
jgi:predicted metal-dependent peptidase